MVRERMGVFHAEAREQNFRIAIRNVIAIAIGVEEEIGRLYDEDAAMTDGHAGGEVQSRNEVLDFAVAAVPVNVFENRDLVSAARTSGRGLGNAVVDGP